MIYPDNFEQKIGFDQIRESLKTNCLCMLGVKEVDEMGFSTSFDWIKRQQLLINEFKQICQIEDNFPLNHYFDVTSSLKRGRIENTFSEVGEVFDFKRSYETILKIVRFFGQNEKDDYPNLRELAGSVVIHKNIPVRLNEILSDQGEIKDSASAELKNIRQQLHSKQSIVSKRMHSIIKNLQTQGLVEADVSMTIRNGRLVIPIDSNNKRQIKCFIHDESATGKTTYIEPAEVSEMNNMIRELEYAEKREIIKILTQFADYIRPFLDDILESYNFLGTIDFIRSKALYALRFNAVMPVISDMPKVNFKNALHPLLFILHQQNNKTIVPLDIEMNEKQRIIVVSGPNAGGKSVCLKTVGLMQYMLQCGMQIPVKEGSEGGIFHKIFIDIGDEQSIENDLSTYSSHLLNMKTIAENADNRMLFLVDELGTGTEPLMGGAIAESLLETLNNKKAYGVVTTHYTNLKHFAEDTEGIRNAAMLYDNREMKPLYILAVGKPGSSFAFEIASKIGMPEDILAKAAEKAGNKNIGFEQNLQSIEQEKLYIEQKRKEIDQASDLLYEIMEKQKKEILFAEKYSQTIIQQAKKQATELIDQSNREIENVIRTIKESQAEKQITQEVRKNLESLKGNLLSKQPEIIANKEILRKNVVVKKVNKTIIKSLNKSVHTNQINEQSPVVEGDFVRIQGQENVGQVIKINKNKVEVLFGNLKSLVTLDLLEKVKQSEAQRDAKRIETKKSNYNWDYSEKMKSFEHKLDLRGKRGEDALVILAQYLDDASLLGVKDLKILHGKGNGILRQLVRKLLEGRSDVANYQDESVEFGGSGITLVKMK